LAAASPIQSSAKATGFLMTFDSASATALEPCRVGDAAVLHGHVEVDAQQHALALHVDVIEGAE